jgi:predicted dehydrogenase
MINVGIIGLNEGNGHPISFSCIINGYDDVELKNTGWDVIYNYIRIQNKADFGFENVKVSHIWTQDKKQSIQIAKAAFIPNIVDDYLEMLGEVDALIIARDDYENHLLFAKPFLDAGCFVFIDKPLSLNLEELDYFKPFILNSKLMSCSGMRFAGELDGIRSNFQGLGKIKLIRGAVLNNMNKYGIHMIESIYSFINTKALTVIAIDSSHESLVITNDDGSLVQIDSLGATTKVFQLDFFGEKGRFHAELNNNFVAFRRTLFGFTEMIKTGKPVIDFDDTFAILKILIAYNISKNEKRKVHLNEIYV